MSYQEFQKRIKKILEEKFAGNAAVIISPVLKNNGIERIGLSIHCLLYTSSTRLLHHSSIWWMIRI